MLKDQKYSMKILRVSIQNIEMIPVTRQHFPFCARHEPWVRGNIAASRDTVTGVAGSNLGGLVLRLGTWRAGRHYPH